MGNDDNGQQGGGPEITRRDAIAGGAAMLAAAATAGPAAAAQAAQARRIPMLDTHIHLFDPNRPQGAPYKGPQTSPVNKQGSFPATYRAVMKQYPVVGAIHVDASPWVEDNLWVLQLCQANPFMVGVIGNLKIEHEDFPALFERHAKNPLLRGLRYGNLWGYNLAEQSRRPEFLSRLKAIADADLVLETANPNVALLEAMVRVNDRVPNLRLMADHLAKIDVAPGERRAFEAVMREIERRPNIYVKFSSSLNGKNKSTRFADHKPLLDMVYGTFGPNRTVFASDWPNVEGDGSVHTAVGVQLQYFASKPLREREKFLFRNSIDFYKWKPRTPEQRRLFV